MTPELYVERVHTFAAMQWTPNVHESVGPVLLWLERMGANPALADGLGGSAVLAIGTPLDGTPRLLAEPGQWIVHDLTDDLLTTYPPDRFHHRYMQTEENHR